MCESADILCHVLLLVLEENGYFLRATRGAHNPNLQVAITHALHVFSQDSFTGFVQNAIGHFRVPPGLCFKTRVVSQPLIWKSFFILTQKNSFS